MTVVEQLKQRVLSGTDLTKEDAMGLIDVPLGELTRAADEIRRKICRSAFDLCTIVNGKCGTCSEDCKYCAQSIRYHTDCSVSYPLRSTEELLEGARRSREQKVMRYAIVTSGKALSDREVDQVCESIRAIREQVGVAVCVSFGLLKEEAFHKIRQAGATRVHCNLESSERFFQEICTTHSYQEKIDTLQAANRAGLSICSGGILGLGETMEDRIDMVLTARELGVTSIPVNVLHPIPGTPYEHNRVLSNEEVCRCVAIFRFLLPGAFIRLAGGRGLLGDQGEACLQSGANAAISGDMLTTSGIGVEADRKLFRKLGFEVK